MGLSLSYLSCQYFGFYWKGQPPSPLFPSLWWAPRDWLSSTFTLPCFAVWWCWVTFCGTATQACDSAKEVTASTRKVRLVLSGVSNWIQLTHLYWPFLCIFFFFFLKCERIWSQILTEVVRPLPSPTLHQMSSSSTKVRACKTLRPANMWCKLGKIECLFKAHCRL